MRAHIIEYFFLGLAFLIKIKRRNFYSYLPKKINSSILKHHHETILHIVRAQDQRSWKFREGLPLTKHQQQPQRKQKQQQKIFQIVVQEEPQEQ